MDLKALLVKCRALFVNSRALLVTYRALFIEYRALFGVAVRGADAEKTNSILRVHQYLLSTRLHTHKHTYKHIRTHAHTHTHTQTHTPTHTHTNILIQCCYTQKLLFSHTHTCTHAHIHKLTHITYLGTYIELVETWSYYIVRACVCLCVRVCVRVLILSGRRRKTGVVVRRGRGGRRQAGGWEWSEGGYRRGYAQHHETDESRTLET